MALAGIIRQSTAVNVMVGPFVDSTDGATAETGLTISQADVRLSKNAGDMAQKSDNTALVHDEIGYYLCELDATDTNTVGALMLAVNESGALPVRMDFQIVEEAVYDALFAASATGGLPVASGGITSASFASGAVTASALATDAVTEITASVVAALLDLDRRGTAQGAGTGSDTLVLAAGDQKTDDFYNGAIIVILEGAGSGVSVAERTRRIVDYANATNQLQVDANWSEAVDNTTVYLIVGG
jgi:hypothetical protein